MRRNTIKEDISVVEGLVEPLQRQFAIRELGLLSGGNNVGIMGSE